MTSFIFQVFQSLWEPCLQLSFNDSTQTLHFQNFAEIVRNCRYYELILILLLLVKKKRNPGKIQSKISDIHCDIFSMTILNFQYFCIYQSTNVFPGVYELRLVVPGYLSTNWVPLHTVKVWGSCAHCVEELPPQQLTLQGHGRQGVFLKEIGK